MKDNDGEWQSRVLSGLGAVSVRVDVTQDVRNESGLYRSDLEKHILS